MSKSVRIKEGSGAWQTESTDIIKTQLVEGGTQNWVPEEQYKSLLDKKVLNVTANGNYTPSSENCDCFSKVVVKLGDGEGKDGKNIYKGPDTVTGKDPNTGEPTTVSTDEDGNIQFNQIPAFIKVTKSPDTITYNEGATIDYTGIIVCAYKADGTAFPIDGGGGTFGNQIPFSELTFPVTTAQGKGQISGINCSDGNGCNAMLINYILVGENEYAYPGTLGTFGGLPATVGGHNNGTASLYVTRYNNTIYASRISGNYYFDLYVKDNGTYRFVGGAGQTSLYEFTIAAWGEYLTAIPSSTINPALVNPNNLRPTTPAVSVPVQWLSKYKMDAYETSTEINIISTSS